jgi:hypothetical protein
MSAIDDHTYYAQLETGARFLASGAATCTERDLHLGMANKYARLHADAGTGGRR